MWFNSLILFLVLSISAAHGKSLYIYIIDGNGSQSFHDTSVNIKDYIKYLKDEGRELSTSKKESMKFAGENAFKKAIPNIKRCTDCEAFIIWLNPESLAQDKIDEDIERKAEHDRKNQNRRRKKRYIGEVGFIVYHFEDGKVDEKIEDGAFSAYQFNYDLAVPMGDYLPHQVITHSRKYKEEQKGNASFNYDETHMLFFGHRPTLKTDHRNFPLETSVEMLTSFGVNLAKYFGKFSSTILSSCKGGTPHVMSLMSIFSKYSIASPGDIHASHLSIDGLRVLEDKSTPLKEKLVRLLEGNHRRQIEKMGRLRTSLALYEHEKYTDFYRGIMKNKSIPHFGEPDSAIRPVVDCADYPALKNVGELPEIEHKLYKPLIPFLSMFAVKFEFPDDPNAKPIPVPKEEHSGWGCQAPAEGKPIRPLSDFL